MPLDRTGYDTTANDVTTGLYRNGQAAGSIQPVTHRSMFTHTLQSLYFFDDTAVRTASGTDTYTASFAFDSSPYILNRLTLIKFTNANTGAATLNINSAGAKDIKKNTSEALVAGDIAAGEALLLAYDGTNYQIIGRRSNGVPLYSEITIPTASVLTANATPVELIAAPGAGKAIVLMETVMSIDFNSAAYATNTNVLIRRNTSTIFTVGGFLNASADAVNYQPGVAGAAALNQNINFQVDAGNPTAGNSDVKIKVWYRIIDVTA